VPRTVSGSSVNHERRCDRPTRYRLTTPERPSKRVARPCPSITPPGSGPQSRPRVGIDDIPLPLTERPGGATLGQTVVTHAASGGYVGGAYSVRRQGPVSSFATKIAGQKTQALVAQWIRASDYGSEGWGFESLRARETAGQGLNFSCYPFLGEPNNLRSIGCLAWQRQVGSSARRLGTI
jgi:hypothetical protein